MALRELPRIDRFELALITRVPQWHPLFRTFEPYPVYGWLIRHPDGLILVDSGFGDHPQINDMYGPQRTLLADALRPLDVTVADLSAVAVSHLHIDHCGQLGGFAAPVF